MKKPIAEVRIALTDKRSLKMIRKRMDKEIRKGKGYLISEESEPENGIISIRIYRCTKKNSGKGS